MTERDGSVTPPVRPPLHTPSKMSMFEPPTKPYTQTLGKKARSWRDYEWMSTIPYFLVQILGVAGLFLFDATWEVWALCFGSYFARMFFVTGAYHRYFSHRTYKTGRIMQFLLALGAETSAQRGVLWWGAHHRDHHKHSDAKEDVHSPEQHGFWHSHMMWIYDGNSQTNYARIKDLAKYPELVLLDRLWLVPPVALGFISYFWMGLPGLFIGFFFSTTLLWHGTFTINSLSHVWGGRRYKTTDDSRNNWVLALITLGEGWHNNHHHFMNSTRQGFMWWEVDITYYILKAMSWVGLVWDLKEPPARVYEDQNADAAAAPARPAREAA